ncbi:MAG: oxidoreductase [Marmoricola sp.]|nr:oxidoreductase [Marmoricola sp.]
MRTDPAYARRSIRGGDIAWAAVGIAIVVALVVGLVVQSRSTARAISDLPRNFERDGGFIVGDRSAPVTVTVVLDYQCPACKSLEELDGALFSQYAQGHQVRIDYRPIAFLDQMSSTRYSTRAMNASGCVGAAAPDAWKSFTGLLFARQPAEHSAGLTNAAIEKIAATAGAGGTAVTRCIEGQQYKRWVSSATAAQTHAFTFAGTPTVLVDGHRVTNPTSDAIRDAVQEHLPRPSV